MRFVIHLRKPHLENPSWNKTPSLLCKQRRLVGPVNNKTTLRINFSHVNQRSTPHVYTKLLNLFTLVLFTFIFPRLELRVFIDDIHSCKAKLSVMFLLLSLEKQVISVIRFKHFINHHFNSLDKCQIIVLTGRPGWPGSPMGPYN